MKFQDPERKRRLKELLLDVAKLRERNHHCRRKPSVRTRRCEQMMRISKRNKTKVLGNSLLDLILRETRNNHGADSC